MMYEGACGEFEDAKYETHPEKMGNYLKHVCSCIGYMDKYQGRNVTQVDLVQLYNDVVCIGEVCGYDIHGFGVGSIQWSFSRTAGLLECYLAECGCDVSGRDFQERLEEYQRASESGDFSGYEGIYINAQQVRWAEAAYIIQELGEGDYACVYSEYLNEANSDPEHDVQIATEIIMEEYIKPRDPDKELPKRQAAAAEWYQVVVGGGNL